jgi:hypothetical protein
MQVSGGRSTGHHGRMEDDIVARIERDAGVPGLAAVLADRLSPTDVQSLLLAVHRRRAAALTPATVLDRYEHSRFTAPSALDPLVLAAFHAMAFDVLASTGYAGVELSPVCPLGTVSVLAPVDQNNVLTTSRNSEVLADATNVLALECGLRRRARLRTGPRDAGWVRLYASHRMVRGQMYRGSGLRPHFQLLALTTAGRDEGGFRFETRSLVEQLGALLRILAGARAQGCPLAEVRVTLTDLTRGARVPALTQGVAAPLRERYPDVDVTFDDERGRGRDYAVDACYHIHARTGAGTVLQLADGGLTTWTQALLGNAKERLLIGGLGVELLLAAHR